MSVLRPYVAKSYFEAYDHMQNIRTISPKINEISRIEKFEITRIVQTCYTHKLYKLERLSLLDSYLLIVKYYFLSVFCMPLKTELSAFC